VKLKKGIAMLNLAAARHPLQDHTLARIRNKRGGKFNKPLVNIKIGHRGGNMIDENGSHLGPAKVNHDFESKPY